MPQTIVLTVEELLATSHYGRVQMISGTHTISQGGVFICDATSGAFAITLPAAKALADAAGQDLSRFIYIKKKDASANAVTVTRAGSDTIDGATTYVLSTQYDAILLADDQDGDAWNIFGTV